MWSVKLHKSQLRNLFCYFLIEKYESNINLLNYFTNSTSFSATAYYSTFVYKSPGSILNEVSKIILAYINSNNLSQTITT